MKTIIHVFIVACAFVNVVIACDDRQFQCADGFCIRKKWLCDGEKDCEDGSDEDFMTCKNRQIACNSNEFKCESDYKCIPNHWRCDNKEDCNDGSDERSCDELSAQQTCGSNMFKCLSDGYCIHNNFVCDTEYDCLDGSDEENCLVKVCDVKTQFQCSETKCIPLSWRCDGQDDCGNGLDEKKCQSFKKEETKCNEGGHLCSDKETCIRKWWMCDGTKDCPDGDDESKDICTYFTCNDAEFRCNDFTCIPGDYYCNGNSECKDNSDELNCPIKSCNKDTEFYCDVGKCIPFSKVCDGIPDCPMAIDESPVTCLKNNSLSFKNDNCTLPCQHVCMKNKYGMEYCDCYKGYKLSDEPGKCEDIDECSILGSCSQNCINSIGHFKCECNEGYLKEPSAPTVCKATTAESFLLLANRHGIHKISRVDKKVTAIIKDAKSPLALDFNYKTGEIYFSDVGDDQIYRANMNGTKEVLIKNRKLKADGLAFDWIYRNIYFTVVGESTIEVVDMSGRFGKVLFNDSLNAPRAIAVDPIEGWMYWSDWGDNGKIERGGMDGSNRNVILWDNIRWVNGLTLDYVNKRLFWVDAKEYSISSSNYDGGQRQLVLDSTKFLNHPFSITTFEDMVYWTDWTTDSVYSANKFTGNNVELVMTEHNSHDKRSRPKTVIVYHPYRQPEGINYCEQMVRKCSHLCLAVPVIINNTTRATCACPTGSKLLIDDSTCASENFDGIILSESVKPDDNQLLVQTGSTLTKTIICITFIIIVISLLVVIFYKRIINKDFTVSSFDNPVYHKTSDIN